MGALTLRRPGQHNDNFDITTTEVQDQSDGSLKKISSVHITAGDNNPKADTWIGLKIDKTQTILGLSVNGKTWVAGQTPMDADAMNEFNRLMPPRQGEKWAAYQVKSADRPQAFTFQTELDLDRYVVNFPDAQTVAIVVCYKPNIGKPLELKNILLGHSLVQSPPPDNRGVKKRK